MSNNQNDRMTPKEMKKELSFSRQEIIKLNGVIIKKDRKITEQEKEAQRHSQSMANLKNTISQLRDDKLRLKGELAKFELCFTVFGFKFYKLKRED